MDMSAAPAYDDDPIPAINEQVGPEATQCPQWDAGELWALIVAVLAHTVSLYKL